MASPGGDDSVVIFLLAVLWLSTPSPEAQSGRTLYYQAQEDLREGRIRQALELLERIESELPGESFADQALLERARILEELLDKPASALELYRLLESRHPDSRLIRRARARRAFLEEHLDQGEEVLVEYLRITREGPGQEPAEAVKRMDVLLSAHPDFSLRPAGMYWQAARLEQAGRPEAARVRLEQLAEEYAGHPKSAQALALMGTMAIQAGDLDAAERAYDSLSRFPDEGWRQSAGEAMGRLSRLRSMRTVLVASLAAWGCMALVLWTLLIARRVGASALARPPVEALVFVVIMGALIVWAWTGTRQTTRALLFMGGMNLLLLLPNGWLLRRWSPRGIFRVAWLLLLVAGCLASVVASVGLAGMEEQVLHTLEWGPD
jgi:hypothetical protein